MTVVTLAQLNINLGTRDELEALADDVGIELEEGMEDLALAEAICTIIDSKNDDDWAAMSDAAKAWSNRVNATKKAYKERMDKAGKGAATERETPPDAGDEAEKTLGDMTVKELKAICKEKGMTGYGSLTKPKLIEAIEAQQAEEDGDWKELTVAKLKDKAKELGVTGFSGMTKPKLIEAIDAKMAEPEPEPEVEPEVEEEKFDTTKEPTKEELAKLKQAAKDKAATSPAKKQTVSEKPYTPDTTAWMVTQCVKEAGKSGITAGDILTEFEKRVKKAKAVCSNPKGRVTTILRQALNIKGLVTKKGDNYYPTAKLNKAD